MTIVSTVLGGVLAAVTGLATAAYVLTLGGALP